MNGISSDIRGGFVRNRRALVATSIVLLLFEAAGIELNQLNLLGNQFALTNPDLVPLALWVAWAYFLLRYYQHFRDLEDAEFRSAWKQRTETTLSRTIRREFPKLFIAANDDVHIDSVTVDAIGTEHEGRDVWRYQIDGSATYHAEGRIGRRSIEKLTFELHRGAIFGIKARSLAWIMLNTRVGTEYALPFVLACLPLIWVLARLVVRPN